mmetsp:Transcript_698/g.1885  ORF Transcript_698/g.1885 Transcript_698/m.1885 type:complete len:272 (+) Transcript_698:700-1515(+)
MKFVFQLGLLRLHAGQPLSSTLGCGNGIADDRRIVAACTPFVRRLLSCPRECHDVHNVDEFLDSLTLEMRNCAMPTVWASANVHLPHYLNNLLRWCVLCGRLEKHARPALLSHQSHQRLDRDIRCRSPSSVRNRLRVNLGTCRLGSLQCRGRCLLLQQPGCHIRFCELHDKTSHRIERHLRSEREQGPQDRLTLMQPLARPTRQQDARVPLLLEVVVRATDLAAETDGKRRYELFRGRTERHTALEAKAVQDSCNIDEFHLIGDDCAPNPR